MNSVLRFDRSLDLLLTILFGCSLGVILLSKSLGVHWVRFCYRDILIIQSVWFCYRNLWVFTGCDLTIKIFTITFSHTNFSGCDIAVEIFGCSLGVVLLSRSLGSHWVWFCYRDLWVFTGCDFANEILGCSWFCYRDPWVFTECDFATDIFEKSKTM